MELLRRVGKLLFWVFLAFAAFTYWGASVRMGRPATLTEWGEQMKRLQEAERYYYGQQPSGRRMSPTYREFYKDFGLNPDGSVATEGR